MSRHPFSTLLERKFLQWQIEIGERKSQAEFAQLLGVSRSALTMWMNGTHLPDRESAGKLANFLGTEIYDLLELPRPDPNLQKIKRVWENIPSDKQQKLAEIAERYETEALKNGSKNASKQRKTKPR
jgi:transcriptional regulator with XRE-family HTH domain